MNAAAGGAPQTGAKSSSKSGAKRKPPASPRKRAQGMAAGKRAPRRPRPKHPPRIRVVKVLVQAHCVVDDGSSNLTELVAQTVEVSAADWREYSAKTFPRALKALERQLAKAAE